MTDTTNEQTEGTTTTTDEAVKPKVKRIRRASQTAAPAPGAKVRKPSKTAEQPAAAKPAKAAAPKAEKPTRPLYGFSTGYNGPSTGLNARVSRTAVDHTRFGTLTDYPMTERDQKNVEALRKQFGEKQFKRENLDAGILRRLGERGCLVYVSGTHADSTYRLTAKGLGKPGRAKKAA